MPVYQKKPSLKSDGYRFRLTFNDVDEHKVSYDQDHVAQIKQCGHNEYKLTFRLTQDNAKDLLSLSRNRQILIEELALVDINNQNTYPIISKQLFTIENLKLTPLTDQHFSGNPLFLKLHIFKYPNASDLEQLLVP